MARTAAAKKKTDVTEPDREFKLISVIRADSPEGGTGKDWCQYIIGHGPNQIIGYRRGTIAGVKRSASEDIVELNLRRMGKTTPLRRAAGRPPKAQAQQQEQSSD